MTIGGLPRPETDLELVFVTFKRPWRYDAFKNLTFEANTALEMYIFDFHRCFQNVIFADVIRVVSDMTFKRP